MHKTTATLATVLILGAMTAAAAEPADRRGGPVATRLVTELRAAELTLAQAQAAGDRAAVTATLDTDFEQRDAATPGTAVPAERWLSAAATEIVDPRIEQMAVHEHGDVAIASFRLSGAHGEVWFLVDVSRMDAGRWRLLTRYRAAVADAVPDSAARPDGR